VRQAIFFLGSAAAGTRVDVSPKDAASLRVLGAKAVAYRAERNAVSLDGLATGWGEKDETTAAG